MSTNKTTNYQLHAWETGDKFLRTEINENFGTIDTALGTKAAQSALNALTQTVGTKAAQSGLDALSATVSNLTSVVNGKAEVVFGTYTGDGQSTRTIYLGFTPRAVLVSNQYNCFMDSGSYTGGFGINPALGGRSNTYRLEVVAGGFYVYVNSVTWMNSTNQVYSYLAVK